MVHHFVTALLALSFQQTDSTTYKNRATAQVVARAQARHALQDTLVHDYTAQVRTRVDAGFGKRRFAVIPPIFAMETMANLTWERPNNLKVDIVGTRSASSIRGIRAGSSGAFDDPWFIPRGLGDSIRFLDDELPETGAVHPLSAIGPEHYRYEITDSLTITLPNREVHAIGIRVEPKRMAPSLVAGNIWLDAETFEVVRMTLAFVGNYLWATPDSATAEDSAQARNDNKWANRIVRVEAELEYALHESRYWMPYRQLVTLTVEIPWFISARIPVHFLSTFSQYRINTGATPRFTIAPDSGGAGADSAWYRCRDRDSTDAGCARFRSGRERARKGYSRAEKSEAGGHWEITVPPRDSLTAYSWPDELKLAPDPAAEELIRETQATLAKIGSSLPAEWVGRQKLGMAWERFSDLWRFNRVQGASVGAGFRLQPGAFTALLGSGRFGFSDHRVTGALVLRRDAPGARVDLGAWRDVREAEPWTTGLAVGNSFNALLAGHDDADYYVTSGGGIAFAANHGLLRDVELSASFERHETMATATHSAINDWLGGTGLFQPNPAVTAGDFGRLSAARPWRAGSAMFTLGSDALIDTNLRAARAWGSARIPFNVLHRSGALSLRGGGVAGDPISQLRLRVGGPQTVRGYDYGTRSGPGMWAAQLDFGLNRRAAFSPVVFVDAGNVIRRGGAGQPLVSAGVGLSLLSGLMRFNFAKGLNPDTRVRFDLLFRAPR